MYVIRIITIIINNLYNKFYKTTKKTFQNVFDVEHEDSSGSASFSEERKVKSLKQVEVVAWIILITISIECFIGIVLIISFN